MQVTAGELVPCECQYAQESLMPFHQTALVVHSFPILWNWRREGTPLLLAYRFIPLP
uniref:Uncharacterized protein n=1 Tax=Anguilla anguilla TaxID=7936 RepID=A0A0E9WUZ8_ANGAN